MSATSLPPHNLTAEKSVLGAVLLDERHLHALIVDEHLRPEHFYRPEHAAVFEAMLDLYNTDRKIDHLTVAERLAQNGQLEELGGAAMIEELAAWVPATGHAAEYGRIVREHSQMRDLLNAAHQIQSDVQSRAAAPRELLEQAERAMLEVAHDERQKALRTIESILDEETERLHHRSTQKSPLTGTPSGYRDLDEKTGGFQAGNLIVLAARPSMGKSALVCNIAENAALAGYPVVLFSLEMSESELAQRFIASQSRTKGDDLRRGRVDERRWPKILEACQRLGEAPLYIDDSSDTGVLEVRAKSRRLHHQIEGGLGLIVIDYLQLMRHEGRIENRVEQVGQISRGLKSLARELKVPVIALSQLSRSVEQRAGDKKPVLSDLRECVTGETLVTMADGRRIPISQLVGQTPKVLAVDADHHVIVAESDAVWHIGRRPVLKLRTASGRVLRATGEHRVLAGAGWRTLSELAPGDRIAIARDLPEPGAPEEWTNDQVALLGQLISGNGSRWNPAGVGGWLKELGIFGQRSQDKRVPEAAFRLRNDQIAVLLRHLWATDGCICSGTAADAKKFRRIYFATASEGLARDVAALLLRLDIVARVKSNAQGSTWTVDVSGGDMIRQFLATVGAFGPRVDPALILAAGLPSSATNVDTLPREVWSVVRSEMMARGVTQRGMATLRGTAYGGSSHFRFAPSRDTVAGYAEALGSTALATVAVSKLFWDEIVALDQDGEEDVYDLTVPGPANWLADGLVTHNSGAIEQDADLVMFIYRDEYYNKESTRAGEADIIVAKHRNGAVGEITLTFQSEFPKFMNYAGARFEQ